MSSDSESDGEFLENKVKSLQKRSSLLEDKVSSLTDEVDTLKTIVSRYEMFISDFLQKSLDNSSPDYYFNHLYYKFVVVVKYTKKNVSYLLPLFSEDWNEEGKNIHTYQDLKIDFDGVKTKYTSFRSAQETCLKLIEFIKTKNLGVINLIDYRILDANNKQNIYDIIQEYYFPEKKFKFKIYIENETDNKLYSRYIQSDHWTLGFYGDSYINRTNYIFSIVGQEDSKKFTFNIEGIRSYYDYFENVKDPETRLINYIKEKYSSLDIKVTRIIYRITFSDKDSSIKDDDFILLVPSKQ